MSIFQKTSSTGESTPVQQPGGASRTARHGAFSVGLVAIAIAAVVVFNLIIAQLPDTATQFDMTNSQIYNITDTTVNYLDGVTSDIEIHVLADKNTLDSRIVRFLSKYVSLSDHLSLEYVNPTVYPSVLTKYGVDANTIVVTCADTGRQETVAIADIIGYDQMSYYMNGTYTETDFDAEGLLTSAVDGVLTDTNRKIYETTGHDETAMPVAMDEQFKKVHLSVSSLNLLTDNGIPDDCDLLIINAPTKDLADDELTMLLNYLAKGGQVIYCMAGQNLSLPNFATLCSTYGMTVTDGMIADLSSNYQNNPYLFFPKVDNTVDAAANVYSSAIIMFYASRGMTLSTPARDTIAVNGFLSTSDQGYNVVDADHQTQGTYVVGAVATETVDGGATARLTVYGCDSLVNADILSSFTNLDNSALFMSSATCGFPDVSAISIEPVSLEAPTNTITTGMMWAILFIFVIPVAALILGFIRWMRRRKL